MTTANYFREKRRLVRSAKKLEDWRIRRRSRSFNRPLLRSEMGFFR